jgi:hypothetical protein
MEHGRSYLMDECQVMASGRERLPTIITPTLAPSSCHRKQASLSANDESAHPFIELFIGSVFAKPRCGSRPTLLLENHNSEHARQTTRLVATTAPRCFVPDFRFGSFATGSSQS